MGLQKISKLFVVPNMERVSPSAFSHLLYGYQKELSKHFEVPLIESWPYGDLSKFDRTVEKAFEHLAMLRRTLIALVAFLPFLRLTSNRNIRTPRILAAILICLVSVRFCLSSNEDISRTLSD